MLGLTGHVDDEKPLWATLDRGGRAHPRLGGDIGSHVTAGLYRLPAQRPAEPGTGFAGCGTISSGWSTNTGRYMALLCRSVFDIDRARDVEAADGGTHRQRENAGE